MRIGQILQPRQCRVAARRCGADEQEIDRAVLQPVALEPVVGLPGEPVALGQFDLGNIETRLGIARARQVSGEEVHRLAAGPAQQHRRLEVEIEHQRRLEQQREGAAEPRCLRLLDIVQDRVGGAGEGRPFAPFAEPEEFVRRDENAQVERFIATCRLVALNRGNALRLQAPGQKVGDFAHEEIADRAAEHANPDTAPVQRGGGVPVVHPRECGLGHFHVMVPLGSQIRLQARQRASDHLGAGERAAFIEPVLPKMPPGSDRIAFEIGVQRQINLGVEQTADPQPLLRVHRLGKPTPLSAEDREMLEELLSDQIEDSRGARVHILVPQRGDKRSLIDLAGNNAKQSYDQRFRIMKPNTKAIQEALQDTLGMPELPSRIECFDISHIQGAETVASMVVWEDGQMKKSDYRKFIIRSVDGVDDFASMREVVKRRYKRVQDEKKKMPSLVLIDGGLGQLHAAAEALESLEIINQPLAAIAKREEIIYVSGQEDEPVALDHHSPVLHLVQLIRNEAHRFAVTFHRKRRQMRDRSTELLDIPGVGERTTRRLLEHFGSVQAVRQADVAALSAVVTRPQAEAILSHFRK